MKRFDNRTVIVTGGARFGFSLPNLPFILHPSSLIPYAALSLGDYRTEHHLPR
jgi:hypothetical protein